MIDPPCSQIVRMFLMQSTMSRPSPFNKLKELPEGSTVSSDKSFYEEFIETQIKDAGKSLEAISKFGMDHLQQAIVLLKSCYMTKFSYLSIVTKPEIFKPFASRILLHVRSCLDYMLGHSLSTNQWKQCLLKPRHGGLGITNIESTANGAYLASLLACLPNIESVSAHQNLNLCAMAFNEDGSPSDSNSYSQCIVLLYSYSIYNIYMTEPSAMVDHHPCMSWIRSRRLMRESQELLLLKIGVYDPLLSTLELLTPYQQSKL